MRHDGIRLCVATKRLLWLSLLFLQQQTLIRAESDSEIEADKATFNTAIREEDSGGGHSYILNVD